MTSNPIHTVPFFAAHARYNIHIHSHIHIHIHMTTRHRYTDTVVFTKTPDEYSNIFRFSTSTGDNSSARRMEERFILRTKSDRVDGTNKAMGINNIKSDYCYSFLSPQIKRNDPPNQHSRTQRSSFCVFFVIFPVFL